MLLVCGQGVDVLELPEELSPLLSDPRALRTPLAVTTPARERLLFTATDSGALFGELAEAGVHLRGTG